MNSEQNPACPNGEASCPIYTEVDQLRSKVATLSTQVRLDFLTGLFNKQHLIYSLEQEMERTQRTHQPTTLILLDGDHFKSVNDNHGHVVGDKVLAHLGRIIQDTVRKIDIPCRYGGEEFAVVLPSTPLAMGIQVAERIRTQIETSPLYLADGEPLYITVSLGVDTHYFHMSPRAEDFIRLADKLLYLAKENGRNQVCHGDTGMAGRTTVTSEEKDALFSSTFKS